MALADFKIFSEFAYTAMSETLDYNVNLFNEATKGGIILTSGAALGDFQDQVMYGLIAGLVRRRNAYGTATGLTEKVLSQILDTSVKVAAGTYPVRIDPYMFSWIQRSPEEAGVVIGKQMAEQSLADMLDTAIRAFRAAHEGVATNFADLGAVNLTLTGLNTGRSKLGDRAGDLVCWVMHSKMAFDLYGQALANSNLLFNFGTVKVQSDGFGNPLIISDAAQLMVAGSPNTYRALGFFPGAVIVSKNNDFLDNVSTTNGDENIKRTYQAEWTYNVGLKGFAWDKTTGGAGAKSPNDTALGTGSNWDKYVTSYKDLGGVVVKSQ